MREPQPAGQDNRRADRTRGGDDGRFLSGETQRRDATRARHADSTGTSGRRDRSLPTFSTARERSVAARLARPRVRATTQGRVRPRVLLASSCLRGGALPSGGQRRVLAGQVRSQSVARSACPPRLEGDRLAGPGRLGMPDEGEGPGAIAGEVGEVPAKLTRNRGGIDEGLQHGSGLCRRFPREFCDSASRGLCTRRVRR